MGQLQPINETLALAQKVSPAQLLKDAMIARFWRAIDLSSSSGLTLSVCNDLLGNKITVTPEIAARLDSVLGTTAGFWVKLDEGYCAALKENPDLEYCD
jgi:HTH-type transcriptional regulator / antitoxin HigA